MFTKRLSKPMSNMKDMLVVFTQGARVNFQLWGHVAPVLATITDDEFRIEPVAWNDQAAKDKWAKDIMARIADGRIREFILVTEAWTANVTPEDKGKVEKWLQEHGSLENWPGRGEIVSVLYASPDEEIEYTTDIIRGTIPMMGAWRVSNRKPKYNQTTFSARFEGLFLKAKAGTN